MGRDKQAKILFLCTGNSCRSQMAEGWARKLKSECFQTYSAGIETHGLNPRAVQVMAEAGVDISHQLSKLVDKFRGVDFNYIVTVCGHAYENCPIFPAGVKTFHVGFCDPPLMAAASDTEEAKLDCYRTVRDQIKDFIQTLPEALNRDE